MLFIIQLYLTKYAYNTCRRRCIITGISMSMRVEEQAIIALFINVSTGFSNLGGDVPGSMTLDSIQALGLATNVQGIRVPYSEHWIPEEQPDFVIDQLSKFFGNSNNDSK